MKIKLTRNEAQEVLHKMIVLSNEPELCADYNITEAQAGDLADSVPAAGGEWEVPDWAIEAVNGEIENACELFRNAFAENERRAGNIGGMLTELRLAAALEKKFNLAQ
jgi:hypothetical protein